MKGRLLLYTDFVCPFCFIAEASTVPRLLSEFDLELEWNGFELHPSTPRGGRPLSSLFPGVHLPSLHEQTRRFAAQFGVRDFSPSDRLSNTRRALAMAEYAREHDRLAPFRQAAFDGNWRQGKNLEDDVDLQAIAAQAGLDPAAALVAADDAAYLERVDRRQKDARAAGVTGIPTFVLNDQRIVGCQPYEALANAARRAGISGRST